MSTFLSWSGLSRGDGLAFGACAEVTSHFRGFDELRTFFERASGWTRSGGSVLANAFLAAPGFEPTQTARELSQISWSTLFTRVELAKATRGLGLFRVYRKRAAKRGRA